MMRGPFLRILWCTAGVLAEAEAWGEATHEDEYRISIQPMLERYCHECHRAEKAKGDLDLTAHQDYARIRQDTALWENIRERLFAFEMPPEGKPAPEGGQREQLLGWLGRLPRPEVDCTKLASDRTQSFYEGHVMSRRLTRDEYERTMRDLMGLQLDLAKDLPADGAGGEGFDTTGDTLFTSPLAVEKYLAAAERTVHTVLPDDETGMTQEAMVARARLLVSRPSESVPARDAARDVLARFMRLAFRRPVLAEEVEKYLALFDRRESRGEGYAGGLRLALTGVLVSPHFLFLVEPEPAGAGTQPLGPFPLASRLSYFLWSSMPDEPLLALAESGALVRDEVLVAQVRRMLADPRADALGERFAVQWLELEKLGTEVRPDPGRFPEFDDALATSMRSEVTRFFNHLIRDNEPLTRLLSAEYTFVNARLASHYGIALDADAQGGDDWHRVALSGRDRGGLLGMAAVHTLTSFPLRTSPVLRGRWILETLLGDKVPPPPPDVPPLATDESAVTAASLRQQLEVHRQNPDCSGCHNKMDPLGFGLESFDALGRLRNEVVDTSGTLPNGETFRGPTELKQLLLGRRDPILKNLMRRMTGYALGRELNRFDQCVIDAAMKTLAEDDARPHRALEAIVLSLPFRQRFYPVTDTADTTATVSQ
ncbi:MAG: DUF1592 domain-containing protein [Verrucomicrobiales bacterium]